MGVGTALYTTVRLPYHFQNCSNLCSDPSTKILLLRLHSVRDSPPNQHLHNPAHHTLCPRFRTISTSNATLLPIISLGATSHNPPNCNTHSLRPRPTNPPAQRESSPLWRIHTIHLFPSPKALESMACGIMVQLLRIHTYAVSNWTCLYKSSLAMDL